MADASRAKFEKELSFEYPEESMKTWQALWGTDFISPGGAQEVRNIIGKEDLKGKSILEIGSGWGGPCFLFAKEYAPSSVVGVDLQPKAVEKATKRCTELGLDSVVKFITVNSLSWPFPDESFDVVFSKDSLLHTEDKETIYAEMKRVLKPGGKVIYADWFGTDLAPTPEFKKWLKDNQFTMSLKSLGFSADLFIRLGFMDIRLDDRCAWFRKIFADDLEKLKGEVGQVMSKDFGAERLQEIYKAWFEPCVVLSEQGQLRLGTLYATKPLSAVQEQAAASGGA